MPRSAALSAIALSLLAGAAGAQDVYVRGPLAEARAFSLGQSTRTVIGVSTAPSGGLRDTLGLLVSSVTSGGPAEKAGIVEGNRLQSINGVSLRASKEDAEDWGAYGFMQRRLTRELAKRKAGEEVELTVYAEGRTRTVKVKTVDADDLNDARTYVFGAGEGIRRTTAELRARADSLRKAAEERASLGISLGSTGSLRDTLGVLVMRVVEGGPADKAGIEEGSRIQAVDGVDLRASRADAEDEVEAGIFARRLSRAIAKKKAGEDVELRVYAAGQTRTVRVKTVRAGDLPHRGGATFFFGEGMPLDPAVAPLAPRSRIVMPAPRAPRAPRVRIDSDLSALDDLDDIHVEVDGARIGRELSRIGPELRARLEEIGPELRWNLERALRDVGPAIDAGLTGAGIGLDAALQGVGRALEDIHVDVDVDVDAAHEARVKARTKADAAVAKARAKAARTGMVTSF
jgi:hypothetical protein